MDATAVENRSFLAVEAVENRSFLAAKAVENLSFLAITAKRMPVQRTLVN